MLPSQRSSRFSCMQRSCSSDVQNSLHSKTNTWPETSCLPQNPDTSLADGIATGTQAIGTCIWQAFAHDVNTQIQSPNGSHFWAPIQWIRKWDGTVIGWTFQIPESVLLEKSIPVEQRPHSQRWRRRTSMVSEVTPCRVASRILHSFIH